MIASSVNLILKSYKIYQYNFCFKVGSILSYILWSRARTFELFVLSRIVGGISKASVSVASAIIADVLPNKSRGKGMVGNLF